MAFPAEDVSRCARGLPVPAGNRVRLPYGERPDGTLAHISEVPSGAKCDCVCPGCARPLVAYKPQRTDGRRTITEHFQHQAHRDCRGAWETTLHKLAKEIVAAARIIRLPAAVAGGRGAPVEVRGETDFVYEAVKIEVPMGDVRPDAVLRRGPHELLVEFHVGHAVDEGKRAKLRARRLPTLEVDLRRVPRLAPRAKHERAILTSSPRHWIFNRALASEEDRLRQEAEREAEAARRKAEFMASRIAREVAAAWAAPAGTDDPSWMRTVHDLGQGDLVGSPVAGERCFSVNTATWQAALIDLALIRSHGHPFSADSALRHLQNLDMLKEPFRLRLNWPPELAARIRTEVPDFRPPAEVLAEYAGKLVDAGVVRHSGDTWSAGYEAASLASQRMEAIREGRERLAELRRRLEALAAAAPEEAAGIRAWIGRPLPGSDASPSSVAIRGGRDWESLLRGLGEITAMLRPYGRALAREELLGLPLEAHSAARAEEKRAREEEERRSLERRRRRQSTDFVNGITKLAEALFGSVEGRRRIEELVVGGSGLQFEEARETLSEERREAIRQTLLAEQARMEKAACAFEARQAQAHREALVAERCRADLQARAEMHFARLAARMGRQDAPAMVDMWMRGRQPRLGGRSPFDYCTDGARLRDCVDMLEAPSHAARRR